MKIIDTSFSEAVEIKCDVIIFYQKPQRYTVIVL